MKCSYINQLVLPVHMKLKYEKGYILETKSGKIEILDHYMKDGKNSFYRYRCLVCGYIDEKNISNISKTGCRVCTNQKIVIGINDMWTTNPELSSLLANPDDGYKYTQCSGKKLNWKCPDCGEIIYNVSISQVYRNKKISCPKCSDGISYPNKFMYYILKSLGENFEKEYSPDWIKPKRYDFVLFKDNKKYIIEMDGGFGHGNINTPYASKELQIEIDNYKDFEAKKRGYNVIRIDCNYKKREDAFEYIKNNILSSNVNKILDLSNVNWTKVQSQIETSNIIKACWIFNNSTRSMKEIAKTLDVHPTTVSRYLKIGNNIELCDYSSSKRYRNDYGIKSMHKVKRYDLNTEKEDIYESIHEASEKSNVHRSSISKCCNGKVKSVKGYIFSYC